MSPHIAIDKVLDGLESPDSRALNEVLVEDLIVRYFTAGEITAEEFHHYSARLLKISRQRKELSACSR